METKKTIKRYTGYALGCREKTEYIEVYLVKQYNTESEFIDDINKFSILREIELYPEYIDDINKFTWHSGIKIGDTVYGSDDETKKGILLYLKKEDVKKYFDYFNMDYKNKTDKIKVIAKIKNVELKEYVETLIKEDGRYEVVMYNINDKYKEDIELIPVNKVIDGYIK